VTRHQNKHAAENNFSLSLSLINTRGLICFQPVRHISTLNWLSRAQEERRKIEYDFICADMSLCLVSREEIASFSRVFSSSHSLSQFVNMSWDEEEEECLGDSVSPARAPLSSQSDTQH
jgi:hypothetical protein